MDDANVPSLLGLPYLASSPDPALYARTRALVWSERNPWFFRGTAGEGIGGPHHGRDMIWPMSQIIYALTSTSDVGDRHMPSACCKASTAGTGFMHESYNRNDAQSFTRAWFAWANTLFGELVAKLVTSASPTCSRATLPLCPAPGLDSQSPHPSLARRLPVPTVTHCTPAFWNANRIAFCRSSRFTNLPSPTSFMLITPMFFPAHLPHVPSHLRYIARRCVSGSSASILVPLWFIRIIATCSHLFPGTSRNAGSPCTEAPRATIAFFSCAFSMPSFHRFESASVATSAPAAHAAA